MLSPDEFLSICEKTALRVGEALTSLIGTKYGAEELYMGADNTPTERLDKIAEDIVIEMFRAEKVCHSLLSEEAGMVSLGGDAGIVYLDPVDGSFNAGVGIPFYALSIALSDGKQVIAGYVRNLADGETFTAVRGKGAYCCGRPIHTSGKSTVSSAAMCVYARPSEMLALLKHGHSARRGRMLGASALELCYVACGRLEVFLDMRGTLRITDAAAAMLILEEAGGFVSLPDGTPCCFPDDVRAGRCLLGSNAPMHAQMVSLLRSL